MAGIREQLQNINAALTAQTALVTKTEVTNSMDYLDAGLEQTVLEIVAASEAKTAIKNVILDLSEMTQNGTIKVYSKIDGTNYVQVGADISFTVATDKDGVALTNESYNLTQDFKVTYTEGADETADRLISYTYVKE
jgi:hypothetical protein